ncbi:MAG: LPS-assembly protein LptD, partial [Pseudomonadales bacterium]|nr:LPS-assembly protein LptD [Pseudomonadales bacterium]
MTKGRVPPWRVMFLLLGTCVASSAIAETAARIDWVPAAELSPAQREAVPWYCDGTYIQPLDAAVTTPSGDQPSIEASADSAQHTRDRFTELIGNARLHQGQRVVEAPRIRLDDNNEQAEVDGPLVLREPGLVMTGEHAQFNLADGTGTIDDASFLLHEPRIRGGADRIHRNAQTDLVVSRGTFTRCDPDTNTWALSGKYLRLEPRTGFGTARNVTVEIEDVPVLWVPWLRFPIDDQRHSGFLMPSFSSDSEGGTDVIIPYYFNLAPQYDATYAPRSMWKRGLIHDGQFRFLTGQTSNEVNAAFLREDDEYDERELVDQTADGTGTVPEFEKEDRWLLFVRHNGGWDRRWQTSINYSAVSDTEYLEDIGGDVGSSSVQQFYSPIDQSLGNRRSAALDRKGHISYQAENWTYTLLVQGFILFLALRIEVLETLD